MQAATRLGAAWTPATGHAGKVHAGRDGFPWSKQLNEAVLVILVEATAISPSSIMASPRLTPSDFGHGRRFDDSVDQTRFPGRTSMAESARLLKEIRPLPQLERFRTLWESSLVC